MKIEVRQTGRRGRGVFATEKIPGGCVVETAPYILIPRRQYKLIDKTVLKYYWYGLDTTQDCALGLGYSSLYNHSQRPNASWRFDEARQTITMFAIRPIRIGQEILINYGYLPPGYRGKRS